MFIFIFIFICSCAHSLSYDHHLHDHDHHHHDHDHHHHHPIIISFEAMSCQGILWLSHHCRIGSKKARGWESCRARRSSTPCRRHRNVHHGPGKSQWKVKALMGTYGYGSKWSTWGTTDLSLFLVLTCINHPIIEVPNFDPHPYVKIIYKWRFWGGDHGNICKHQLYMEGHLSINGGF